jgi:uncharacterized phage infection (PIP) family protein YhgE
MAVDKNKLEEQIKKSLGKVIAEVMDFASTAESQVKTLKGKISQIDKSTAKATLGQLSVAGLTELHKAQEKLQTHIDQFSKELQHKTKDLGKQTGKIVKTTQGTLKEFSKQIKSIAEAERTKRRGRRRSQ